MVMLTGMLQVAYDTAARLGVHVRSINRPRSKSPTGEADGFGLVYPQGFGSF